MRAPGWTSDEGFSRRRNTLTSPPAQPRFGRDVRRGLAAALVGVGAALAAAGTRAGTSEGVEEGVELPQWELGIGVAPLTVPTYRGSSRQRNFVFPVPFVVYRGDWLRVDRGGAQGLLWESDRVELDVSADGAVPAESTDDGPRAGMEDLAPIVELGPSLEVLVDENDQRRLELQLPVRAAVAIESGRTNQQGWKFHPQLNYDAPDLISGWDIGISAGPIFGSRTYHGYYYDVPPSAQRPDRPAYRADAGYSGASLLASASQRFDDMWVGGFIRYDNLSGAAFEESPLVETQHAVSAGFAVSWVLWTSEATVTVDRDNKLSPQR